MSFDRRKSSQSVAIRSLSKLSFVSVEFQEGETPKLDLWNVSPSADYDTDVYWGGRYAIELISQIRAGQLFWETQTSFLLEQVTEAIFKKGQWSGLEAGFFRMISEALTEAARQRATALPDKSRQVTATA